MKKRIIISILAILMCGIDVCSSETFNVKYWFDDQKVLAGTLTNVTEVSELNVSMLSTGPHTLHLAVYTNESEYVEESSRTYYFYKDADEDEFENARLTCSINGVVASTIEEGFINGSRTFNLDVHEMEPGLHNIMCMVTGVEQVYTAPVTSFFMINPISSDLSAMRLTCSINGVVASTIEEGFINGSRTFNLDVHEMPAGLHTLTYLVGDDKLMTTAPTTSYFRISDKLDSYEYWLNDKESDAIKVSGLNKYLPTEMNLDLSVKTQPISSKSFFFQWEDGVPALYSVPELNLRIIDEKGSYDECKSFYTDTQSRTTVTSVSNLESGIPTTTMAPLGNDIYWYQFIAKQNDKVSLQVNRPCTMRLYSPANKEIYTATGAKAQEVADITIPTKGVYYLAIHDISDDMSQETISITAKLHGDVNGDFKVDKNDASMLANIILGKVVDARYLQAADINGNGTVDATDIVLLVNMIPK